MTLEELSVLIQAGKRDLLNEFLRPAKVTRMQIIQTILNQMGKPMETGFILPGGKVIQKHNLPSYALKGIGVDGLQEYKVAITEVLEIDDDILRMTNALRVAMNRCFTEHELYYYFHEVITGDKLEGHKLDSYRTHYLDMCTQRGTITEYHQKFQLLYLLHGGVNSNDSEP